VDKRHIADAIRRHLERRVACLLNVKPEELPRLKLGTLVHFMFLLKGDSEELGGFNTTMSAVLQLVGHELTWDIEEEPNTEPTAQAVIN
jgi:hypothetical protein